ncbi:hypothetical protein PENSPDRAFT_757467 [Peniophora sp. CONT]|nr:hypothetical protein PENSPDRAFT_757467 [Peniophora sp. CONT]
MLRSNPLGSFDVNQVLEVDNALSEFYYTSFYRPLLAASFFVGIISSAALVCIAWLWTQIRCSQRRTCAMLLSIAIILSLVALLCIWAYNLQAQFALINNGGLFQPSESSDPNVYSSSNFIQFLNYREIFMDIPTHATETVLFGVATSLLVPMIYVVHRKRQSGLGLMGITIPILCVVMYLSAMGYWILGAVFTADQISSAGVSGGLLSATPDAPGSGASLRLKTTLSSTFFSLNLVLSDVVVFWRMWVVWNKSRAILVMASIFVLATTALCIANVIVQQAVFVDPDRADTLATTWGSLALTFGANALGLAALFTSLASNVTATALIGLKAWLHRRRLTDQMAGFKRLTVAERVLVLLIESGALYICIWIFYSTTVLRPDLYIKDYTIDFSNSWNPPAQAYIQICVPQLTAIYPMLILILVALDRTLCEHQFTYNHDESIAQDSSLRQVTINFDVDVERSGDSTSVSEKDDSKKKLGVTGKDRDSAKAVSCRPISVTQ